MYYSEDDRRRAIETTQTVIRILKDDFPYEDDIMAIVHNIESDHGVDEIIAIGALRDYMIAYSKMRLRELDRRDE